MKSLIVVLSIWVIAIATVIWLPRIPGDAERLVCYSGDSGISYLFDRDGTVLVNFSRLDLLTTPK